MKPLQYVAVGLLLIAFSARLTSGYDLAADPVGWLLVILGVARVPPLRAVLIPALVALAVSVPLWFPALNDRLQAADPSLVWTANLPQVITLALLCRRLQRAAEDRSAGFPRAVRDARWWRDLFVGEVIVGVLPVLASGAGASLTGLSYLVSGLVLLGIVVLLFAHASRPWVADHTSPEA